MIVIHKILLRNSTKVIIQQSDLLAKIQLSAEKAGMADISE
jgi:hypothetical protein